MAGRDQRLDNFLKKTLKREVYNQIEACEPCVVSSENDKYSFRYAVITSDAVLIADNPPKAILCYFLLTDLKKINLVHDVANFLQKDLQRAVQHLHIQVSKLKTSCFSSILSKPQVNIELSDGVTASQTSSATLRNSTSSTISMLDQMHLHPLYHHSLENLASNQISQPTRAYSEPNIESQVFLTTPEGSIHSVVDIRMEGLDSISSNGSINGDSLDVPYKRSSSWQDICTQSVNDGIYNQASQDLHLYILNERTTFHLMLDSVWKTYLLNATADIDFEIETPVNSARNGRSTVQALFSTLKREILYCISTQGTAEEIFRLMNELKTSAKLNVEIKHLFWRDSELFVSFANVLMRFVSSKSKFLAERADEIECASEILETLIVVLQNTNSSASCHKILQRCSKHVYTSFLTSMIKKPYIHEFLHFEAELVTLSTEYRRFAIKVIYNFILIAEQASWFNVQSNPTLTVDFLFSSLNSHSELLSFVSSLVSDCVSLWCGRDDSSNISTPSPRSTSSSNCCSSQDNFLSGEDVANLYQYFKILNDLIRKSKNAKAHAVASFKEEFRYYIRCEDVNRKLHASFPCSKMTCDMIAQVAACILDNCQE